MDTHFKGNLKDNSYLAQVGQLVVLLTSTTPKTVAKIDASTAKPVFVEFKLAYPTASGTGYSGGVIVINGNTIFFGGNFVNLVLTAPVEIAPAKSDGAALNPYFILRVTGVGIVS
jgi:hypothetical protein